MFDHLFAGVKSMTTKRYKSIVFFKWFMLRFQCDCLDFPFLWSNIRISSPQYLLSLAQANKNRPIPAILSSAKKVSEKFSVFCFFILHCYKRCSSYVCCRKRSTRNQSNCLYLQLVLLSDLY